MPATAVPQPARSGPTRRHLNPSAMSSGTPRAWRFRIARPQAAATNIGRPDDILAIRVEDSIASRVARVKPSRSRSDGEAQRARCRAAVRLLDRHLETTQAGPEPLDRRSIDHDDATPPGLGSDDYG